MQVKPPFYSKHRLFFDGALEIGKSYTLSQTLSHYLGVVLRLKENARCVLFNNSGYEFDVLIMSIQKKAVVVQVSQQQENNKESPFKITLALSLITPERFDWAIQKATELGVFAIQPIIAKYSQIKLSPSKAADKLKRRQQICISASEQCERGYVPNVTEPMLLETCVKGNKLPVLVGEPQAKKSIKSLKNVDKEALCLIGPEGGWHKDELLFLKKNHATFIGLGNRILRAETAAVSMVSLLQHQFGDLN